MLVLSRKVGERIYINNDIVVTVVSIDGNKARLGIEAPPPIPIYREELWKTMSPAEKAKSSPSLPTASTETAKQESA